MATKISVENGREGKASDVEEALFIWFTRARDKNAPSTRDILCDKARSLAESLGVTDFNPTDGWLTRWKVRNNIVYKKFHGEKQDANKPRADCWLSDVLPPLLTEYSPADIFNTDESGLYYRAMPDSTLTFHKDNVAGGKKSKDRLTVLFTCNMDGSEKRCPLVVGKRANPRCLI